MNTDLIDEIISNYNASVERMQKLPIDEWERKAANAEDEKHRKKAERMVETLEGKQMFELGVQGGIDTVLGLLGYEISTDDCDFAVSIAPMEFDI